LGPAVLGENIFGDPEIDRADYQPHREPFLARLRGARRLNVAPAANALARLQIFEDRIAAD
jgi:hypothetical protein